MEGAHHRNVSLISNSRVVGYMAVGHLIQKTSGEKKKNRVNFENGGKENPEKDFLGKKSGRTECIF